ncbi:M24 family metallopeptidase [Candidatus Saccharibacteria bacterium]|nr:MAG: M24 family metallopeptidase [Candidatus Saccharibacteria bacterium]
MSDLLSADFYAGNRKRLRSLFQGTAPIVITAAGSLQQGSDYAYSFHQDGSFLYLTGLNNAELVLVIDRDREYLILPERSHVSDVFDGSYEAESFAKISGISEVLDYKVGWKKLATRLKRSKHVATLAPPAPYVDVLNLYTNPARAVLMEKIKTLNPDIEPLDLRQHLAVMRMIKQPAELAAIQKAVDTTVKTFQEIQKKLPKLRYEYEVEALLGYGFRRRGADGHAYSPIVGVGQNACTLHYEENNDPLTENQLLLIDAGAQVNRYAADITRTFAIGQPTKRQRQVYDAVLEVHEFALTNLKAGISIRDNEKTVEQFMGEKLRSLGLIRNVEREEIRKYYPHATSHFLGLDVHDGGDYDKPLESGVVLTVEPGIYIPEEGIGIRIEDDVLITATGIDVLSAKLPTVL